MVTVDSKGRVVLPKEVRERLGIEPGTVVEIRAEDGTAVVEPETEPERVIERMESLIEDAAADRRAVDYDDLDVFARDHVDTVRRQAREAETDAE